MKKVKLTKESQERIRHYLKTSIENVESLESGGFYTRKKQRFYLGKDIREGIYLVCENNEFPNLSYSVFLQ